MKKLLKRLAYIIITLFAAVIISFTLVLYLYSNKIKAAAIDEINKRLIAKVSVGKIDVSIRKFPAASLLLKDVYTAGVNSSPGDTLLYAHKVFLEFNLWDIIFSEPDFKKISLEEGSINITEVSEGIYNYNIWKKDTISGQNSLGLQEVELTKIRATYTNTNSLYSANVKQLIFSGSITNNSFLLKGKGQANLHKILIKKDTIASDIPLDIEMTLSNKQDTLRISEGLLIADKIPLQYNLISTEGSTAINIDQSKFALNRLQALAVNQKWLSRNFPEITGDASIESYLNFPANSQAQIIANFSTNEASVKGVKGTTFKKISCQGFYELTGSKSKLKLEKLKGSSKSGQFEGQVLIDDFHKPYVEIELKSNLLLEEYLALASIDTIAEPKGRIEIDALFKNRFSSLKKIAAGDFKYARADGTVKLENLSFSLNKSDQNIAQINSDLILDDNDFKIDQFYLKKGKSDLYLKGYFKNVLNYIFLDYQALYIDAQLISQEIRLEDFLWESSGEPGQYSLNNIRKLSLDLNLKIDRFTFKSFASKNISTELKVGKGLINIPSFGLEADKGIFSGSFTVDARSDVPYPFKANLKAKDVNIHDLFLSFKNFNQKSILADNIYGTTNTNLIIKGQLNKHLSVEPSSIDLIADVSIKNGRLKNYEPLTALSRFSDVEELKDVKFATLTNQIFIKDSEINIPEMEINSNILNLELNGKHTFSNNIDYLIKLEMSDLLFSKRKKKQGNGEFEQHLVEVEKGDKPKIPIRMSGPASNPKITVDNKSLGHSIIDDIKEEGKELKELFKGKEEKPNPEEKIIFEWEEDTTSSGKN